MPRLRNCLEEDFVEDLQAGFSGDGEGFFHDLVLQAVIFQVHLNGSDALGGTGHFEVHFAVEVFNALDVDEGGEIIPVLNQAAGDAGDGRLDGHARIHQSQCRAADGALRGGAVRGENFGNHTNGVGEVFHIGDNAFKSLLYQSTVAVFTPAGTPAGTCLAGGVGGHIVVMHKALLFLFPDGIQLLGLRERGEGCNGENLGLAAGKQAGAVHLGQHTDFRCKRTDLIHGTAVNTLALQQPLFHDLLLELVDDLVHVLHHIRMVCFILLLHGSDPLVDAGFADILIVGIQAVFHAFELVLHQFLEELIVECCVVIFKLRLADLFHHLVDEIKNRLQVLMRLDNAFIHHFIGHLVGFRLDHNDLLVGGCHSGGHPVGLALFCGGVEEILLTVPAQHDAGDRAVKGDIRNGDSCGGADHGGDLRGAVAVNGEDLTGDNHVVAQVAGEKGTHGAVNQAGSQHCGETGLTLTALEAAGNSAHSVELLVEVNGEGEIVDTIFRTGGSSTGDQHYGLAVGDEHCRVAKLCQLADLHLERTTFISHFKFTVVGEFSVFDNHVFYSLHCGRFS